MIDTAPSIVPACHAIAAGVVGDGWLAAAAVLLAGLLGTIMPCTVQMAVILSSLLTSPGSGTAAIAPGDAAGSGPVSGWAGRLLVFLAGYIATFVAAAGLAGLLVHLSGRVIGIASLQIAGGLMLAAFGLQMLGWLRLPGTGPCGGPIGFFLGRPYRSTPRPGRMGMTFAMYCAGCCGPAALGSALLLSGSQSAAVAALLLLVYAVGMAIPFIVLAVGFVFALRTLRLAIRFTPLVSMAGGGVAVIAGALLAFRPLAGLFAG